MLLLCELKNDLTINPRRRSSECEGARCGPSTARQKFHHISVHSRSVSRARKAWRQLWWDEPSGPNERLSSCLDGKPFLCGRDDKTPMNGRIAKWPGKKVLMSSKASTQGWSGEHGPSDCSREPGKWVSWGVRLNPPPHLQPPLWGWDVPVSLTNFNSLLIMFFHNFSLS